MKLFSVSLALVTAFVSVGSSVNSHATAINLQNSIEPQLSFEQTFSTPGRGIPGRRESGGTR
jgi:hypothetical protein